MGFDIGDRTAGSVGDGLESADLVHDVVGQFGPRGVDEASPEACEIAITHLCADADAVLACAATGARQRARIACMESARDVGAGDHLEYRVVVAELPPAERLPDIAVEIDTSAHATVRARRSSRVMNLLVGTVSDISGGSGNGAGPHSPISSSTGGVSIAAASSYPAADGW